MIGQRLSQYAMWAMLILIVAGILGAFAWLVASSPMQAGVKIAFGLAGVMIAFLILAVVFLRRRRHGGRDRGYSMGSPQPAPWEFTGTGWGSANQDQPTYQEGSEDPERGRSEH